MIDKNFFNPTTPKAETLNYEEVRLPKPEKSYENSYTFDDGEEKEEEEDAEEINVADESEYGMTSTKRPAYN